jgi:hypothetical protein
MGYYARKRRGEGQPIGAVEILLILIVVLAVAALIAWIITSAGGGVLMN